MEQHKRTILKAYPSMESNWLTKRTWQVSFLFMQRFGYIHRMILVVVFFQDNNMPWSQIYFPEATSKDGVERNKLSGKNVFDNGNRLLTIVKQEPDGNIELLQKHHKIDLPISRQSYKRFNINKRRSTIDVPDARILYLPRYKRKLSHPTTSIFKSRR